MVPKLKHPTVVAWQGMLKESFSKMNEIASSLAEEARLKGWSKEKLARKLQKKLKKYLDRKDILRAV